MRESMAPIHLRKFHSGGRQLTHHFENIAKRSWQGLLPQQAVLLLGGLWSSS